MCLEFLVSVRVLSEIIEDEDGFMTSKEYLYKEGLKKNLTETPR